MLIPEKITVVLDIQFCGDIPAIRLTYIDIAIAVSFVTAATDRINHFR